MLSFFVIAIAELVCVAWAYDLDRFFADILRVHGTALPAQNFFRILWQGVSIAYPVVLASFCLVNELLAPAIPDLPMWALVLGWSAALLPSLCIVGSAIFPPSSKNSN